MDKRSRKTILLTGATGFLGCHLLEALLKADYRVVILKRSFSDTWRIKHLLDRVSVYDIDHTPVNRAFEDTKIDVVIHTAASYGRNNDSVSNIVKTNLMFPLSLLETAVHFNTHTFFNTDTLLPEDLNNYALSKKQFAKWLRMFSENKKIRGVNLKIEHMYGPKDASTKFGAWLLCQMNKNVERIPLTNGEQKRDFIYISDVVSAYILLLKRVHTFLNGYNEFEVGTGISVPVKDFVLAMKTAITKTKVGHIDTTLDFGALPYRRGESMELKAHTGKLRAMGWKPEYTLNSGIKRYLIQEGI